MAEAWDLGPSEVAQSLNALQALNPQGSDVSLKRGVPPIKKYGSFRKLGLPYSRVLTIRILLVRVLS